MAASRVLETSQSSLTQVASFREGCRSLIPDLSPQDVHGQAEPPGCAFRQVRVSNSNSLDSFVQEISVEPLLCGMQGSWGTQQGPEQTQPLDSSGWEKTR